MRIGNIVDSDGNRVNLGNFDEDGLNVNNNWDDNRNSNIGLSSSRQSIPSLQVYLLGLSRKIAIYSGGGELSRLQPAAEHTTDFVHKCLQSQILFMVDDFGVFG